MLKRWMFLIVLLLVLGILPLGAFADESSDVGLSMLNPVPAGQTLLTSEQFLIKVTNCVKGKDITIAQPPPGYKTVLVEVSITNKNPEFTEAVISTDYFYLTGSSNVKYRQSLETLIQLKYDDQSQYNHLFGFIKPDETITGWIAYHVPEKETDLVLVWELLPWQAFDRFDRFFKVE